MKTKRFHHIIDLNNCNNKIFDQQIVCDFVEEVVEALDMSILKGPITANGIEENPGLSVLAIIDFSHISIHTFKNNQEALIDIFSCKKYNRETVLQIAKKYFETPNTTIRKKEVWWG